MWESNSTLLEVVCAAAASTAQCSPRGVSPQRQASLDVAKPTRGVSPHRPDPHATSTSGRLLSVGDECGHTLSRQRSQATLASAPRIRQRFIISDVPLGPYSQALQVLLKTVDSASSAQGTSTSQLVPVSEFFLRAVPVAAVPSVVLQMTALTRLTLSSAQLSSLPAGNTKCPYL